jgi:hypothetical protein
MEKTNEEFCALWMEKNHPEYVESYTFTDISEEEFIVEWPENRVIIKWTDPDKTMAQIIDYPYVT